MTTSMELQVSPVDAVAAVGSPATRVRRVPLSRLVQWVLVIAIVAGAVVAGVELRRWIFVATVPVRFEGDINNAFHQGSSVYEMAQRDGTSWVLYPTPTLGQTLRAYLKRYDTVVVRGEGNYGLDYPPARLLIMTLWAHHVRSQRSVVQSWSDADLIPLLWFNTCMTGLASVAAFLLVRHWRAVGARGGVEGAEEDAARGRPLWLPLGCALLLWFNLAVLVNGHVWPQWDVWLVAFYLWAVYLASRGWWFAAGATIGLGCMFKGQLLIATPALMLWPLLRGQAPALVRQVVGFAFMVAVLTSVWLYGGAGHGQWLAGMAAAGGLVLAARWERVRGWLTRVLRASWRWALAAGWAMLVAGLVLMGWWRADEPVNMTWGLLLVACMLLPAVFVRQVPVGLWAAGMFAATMFLGGLMYGGSYSWLKVGFVHGSDQYQGMYAGHAYNLASLLNDCYGWRLRDEVEWLGGLQIKQVMRYLFGALTVLVGLAAALQSRRNSTRMLVVLTAPWLLMYASLGQMHERYLMYSAAVSAIAVGFRASFLPLHLFLTALASALMWRQQRGHDVFWPELHRLIMGFSPGMAWAVLLTAGIFLYVSLGGGGKGRSEAALGDNGELVGSN